MGIETILIVFGIIAVVAIVVAARRSKQRIEQGADAPPASKPDQRPPPDTISH